MIVGLVERACATCGHEWRGSAGQRCPSCLAYAPDYGPVFHGRRLVLVLDRSKAAWELRKEYQPVVWPGHCAAPGVNR